MENKDEIIQDSNINVSQIKALKELMIKQQQEKFSFSKLKTILPYIKKHSFLIVLVVIASVISAGILLPVPYLTKLIIDEYVADGNIRMLILMSVVILIIYFIRVIVRISLNYSFSLLNNRLLLSIRKDLINKIIDLPVSFFTKTQSGYLLSRINEIDQLGSIFSIMFIQLIVSILTFLFSLVVLGVLAWKILLLAILFIPIHYLLVKKFAGGMQNISKSMMEKSANLNKDMQEVISGIQTVKAFATEKKEKNKLNSSIQTYYKRSLTQNIFMGISQDIIGFIINISNLLVLTISALLIINNQFTIGLYIACIQYVAYIFKPIQSFASAGVIMQPAIVALNRIDEYFNLIGEDNRQIRKKEPVTFLDKIIFKDVCFYYEKEKPVLDNISFEINQGEKIALIGDNGSGKTTIGKLLLQLYLPVSGNIFIGNTDIKEIKLEVLRNKIGIVSQEIFLFNDTIKNNFTYGCFDYSEEELKTIVDKFCNFINIYPEGINTYVGENGINLSGGQKQALSIVRTLLKHPDILIWDEGNLHLDRDTKLLAQELINEYFIEKTCIFITHDSSFIKNSDKVFKLENKAILQVK